MIFTTLLRGKMTSSAEELHILEEEERALKKIKQHLHDQWTRLQVEELALRNQMRIDLETRSRSPAKDHTPQAKPSQDFDNFTTETALDLEVIKGGLRQQQAEEEEEEEEDDEEHTDELTHFVKQLEARQSNKGS